MNLEELSSSSTGLLQPPLTWQDLPNNIQSAIARMPFDSRQKAIDQFATEVYWFRARRSHERFLQQISKTEINEQDSLCDIWQKLEDRQKLLIWHHESLHPETCQTKTLSKFQLKQIVKVDNLTGKIVGIYWNLWNMKGWVYLVEWDESTGDGHYIEEGKIDHE